MGALSLGEVCRQYRLEQKILVAPSPSIGHQLLETLPKTGTPWLNLSVTTIDLLAKLLTNEGQPSPEIKLATRSQASILIEATCRRVLNEKSYFGCLRDTPGLHTALLSTLSELRLARVTATTLRAQLPILSPIKWEDLALILESYAETLSQNNLIDRPGIIRAALAKAISGKRVWDSTNLVLVPEHLELNPVEQKLLKTVAGDWIPVTMANTAPRQTRFWRCLAEENEARAALREIFDRQLPLDDCEVVYTDESTYPALIWELTAEHRIPCTFAGGLPARLFRPAQTLLGWLEWIQSDYEAERLCRLLLTGSLNVEDADRDTWGRLDFGAVQVIRKAKIRWGRGRYIEQLEKLKNGTLADTTHPPSKGQIESAKAIILRILEFTPVPNCLGQISIAVLAVLAYEFLIKFVRATSDLETEVIAELQRVCEAIAMLDVPPVPFDQALTSLKREINAIRIEPGRPQPGSLHLAHWTESGFSGRPHTFILGLNEEHFPGKPIENPILLDAERQVINQALGTNAMEILSERPTRSTAMFRKSLSRMHGTVTMSHVCQDLENQERFPAAIVLEQYREATKQDNADFQTLAKAAGDIIGFVPGSLAASLTESEWWLRHTTDHHIDPTCIREIYPWLGDGWTAAQHRKGKAFTAYDGWVSAATELDPRISQIPISCSRLEYLAECPFAYFLLHGLDLEAAEEVQRNPLNWLNPAEHGTLLHEVFEQFLCQLPRSDPRPRFNRDWPTLQMCLDQNLQRWRKELPVPSEAAYILERRIALITCRNFLASEDKNCQEATPRFFELAFGMPGSEYGAVRIVMAGKEAFLLHGRIDRIDDLSDEKFCIWDYKTGTAQHYREESYLNGGTELQHALYAVATEAILQTRGERGHVIRSGYFFPGPRGERQRIVKEPDFAKLHEGLTDLLAIVRNGTFLATPIRTTCTYCPYHAVCGGDETNKLARLKLENTGAENDLLQPIRSLLNDRQWK